MRPVARPYAALRVGLDQRLGQYADIGVVWWSEFGGFVWRGEFDPGVAASQQTEQSLEPGMAGRHRLEKLSVVVDDERHRQPRQRLFMTRQLAAIELQLDMPSEIPDARRHRLERVPAQKAAGQHMVPDAPDAGLGQAFEFIVRNVDRNGGDASRRIAQRRQRFQCARIVIPVTVGLDDDGTGETQRFADHEVVANGRMGRFERRLRNDRKPVLVNMHMAIAGVCGNLQNWCLHRLHAPDR